MDSIRHFCRSAPRPAHTRAGPTNGARQLNRLAMKVAAMCLLSMGGTRADPGASGALAFANPDAVPSHRPRGMEGATPDPGMFPRRTPPLARGFAAGAHAPAPGARGRISTYSLPFRTFSTQQQVAEALELSQVCLELHEASSVSDTLKQLSKLKSRVKVRGNRRRLSKLRGVVSALAASAFPFPENAWPSVRTVLVGVITAWLSQSGKIP